MAALAYFLVKNLNHYDKKSFQVILGVILSLIVLEVPSGFTVAAIVCIAICILSLKNSRNFRFLFVFVWRILAGFFILCCFESLLLLLLGESPRRLLSNFQYIIWSQVNNNLLLDSYWKYIDFLNPAISPAISLFVFILFSLIILSLSDFSSSRKNALNIFSLSWVMVALFLLLMQNLRRTYFFNFEYFLVPFNFSGIILIVTFILSKVSSKASITILVLAVASFLFRIPESLTLYFLILVLAFFIGNIFKFKRVNLKKISVGVVAVFFPLFLQLNTITLIPLSDDFWTCDKLRNQIRVDVLTAASQLDQFGKRGSLMIAADESFFPSSSIVTSCKNLPRVSTSELLAITSYLGFYTPSILGALKNPRFADPQYETLSNITSRPNAQNMCALIFTKNAGRDSRSIRILKTNLNFDYKCPQESLD